MAAILPYLRSSVFEPEITHAMSVAFDEVCQALGVDNANEGERRELATKIIALARSGERNADRMRDRVLRERHESAPELRQTVRKWRGVG